MQIATGGFNWRRPTYYHRESILRRYKHTCAGCGGTGDKLDHKKPLWAGGHGLWNGNLQVLCDPCHKRKTKWEAGQRKFVPKRILSARRDLVKAYKAAEAINRNRVLKRDGCVCAECGKTYGPCNADRRRRFSVVPFAEPYPPYDSDLNIVASDYRVLCRECYWDREVLLVDGGMYDQYPF